MTEDQGTAAVVIGAGELGRAIARALGPTHRVVLIDRDPNSLARAAAELPDGTLTFEADASSPAELASAFDRIPVGSPVSAVAVAVGTTGGGSIAGLEEERWHATIDSCLTAVFVSLQVAVNVLVDRGGAICVLGSVHATRPQPGYPAYAAAKAGVSALTKQVAAEYGHRGIRANLVVPGWTEASHTRERAEGERRQLVESTALRSLNSPVDIAEAVRFLLSPAARQISGAEIVVDGGAQLLGADTVLRPQYRALLGLS